MFSFNIHNPNVLEEIGIPSTIDYHPDEPLLIWDGKCGFCRFWVSRWRYLTRDLLKYVPYQQRPKELQTIPDAYFKKAVRLVGTRGEIYTGAAAVYQTLQYSGRWKFLCPWYNRFPVFRSLSDKGYYWVAQNRPLLLKITRLLFGSNPARLRHYWAFYLVALFVLLYFCYTILA